MDGLHNQLKKPVKYFCPLCDKRSFLTIHRLSNHINYIHAKRFYVCNKCKRSFRDRRSLRTHSRIHKDIKSHTCNVCQKIFCSSTVLKIHNYHHIGVEAHVCKVCGERFITQYHLSRHLIVHQKRFSFNTCEFCSKQFHSKSKLLFHRAFHTGVKSEVSNSGFTTKQALDEHCFVRTDSISPVKDITSERYQCSDCGKYFYSFQTLKMHSEENHKDNNFPCDLCSQSFQHNSELVEHYYATHISKSQFTCNICNAGFKEESDLKEHKEEKHRPAPVEKRFKCDVCGQCFIRFLTLDRHYKTHIGGFPFICEICDISYALESSLQNHNEIEHPPYSNESNQNWKQYTCSFCPLVFVRKMHLKLHEVTHKKKQSFPCDECSESFKSDVKLQEHYLVHVEDHYALIDIVASHGCSVCHKFFPSFPELEEHKLLHGDTLSNAPIEVSMDLVPNMCTDISKREVDIILKYPNLTVNEIYSDSPVHNSKSKNCLNNTDNSEESLKNNVCIASESSNDRISLIQINSSENSCSATSEYIDEDSNANTYQQFNSVEDSNICADDNSIGSDAENEYDSIEDSNISTDDKLSNTLQDTIELGSECNVVEEQENGIETYYIISENADGTFESNIFDNNCVIVVDNLQQVKDVAQDIEIVGVDETESFVESECVVAADVEIPAVDEPEEQHELVDQDMVGMKKIRRGKGNRYYHGKEILYCDICVKTFTSKRSLSNHMYIHTGEKPLSCHICNKQFRHQTSLRSHIHTHDEVKPFACFKCDKSFVLKEGLKRHLLSHDGVKPYSCDVCGKGFAQKNSVKIHQSLHTDYKPYKCEVCNKSFRAKHVFVTHQMVHRGERPKNTCDECGKICYSNSELKTHQLQHTGEKPHACDLCPKVFTTQAYLKNHYVKHTKEGRYNCDICGKPFYMKSELVKHLKWHKGTKDFMCDLCGETFVQKSNLRLHYATHTRRDPYECKLCGVLFKTFKDVRTHRIKIHQDKRWPKFTDDTLVVDPNIKLGHLAVLKLTEVESSEAENVIETIVEDDPS